MRQNKKTIERRYNNNNNKSITHKTGGKETKGSV